MKNIMINSLTGATSGNAYKISGFSANPSLGPVFYSKDQVSYRNDYTYIGEWCLLSTGEYLGGIGLYADRIDSKYYWYIYSCNYEEYEVVWGNNPVTYTLKFYPISGGDGPVTPGSNPVLVDGNGHVIDDTHTGNVYLWAQGTDYQNGPQAGYSLGFWPFYHEQRFNTCFIKGSQVKLANGTYKNIEDVVPGDVVSYITDAGLFSTTTVVAPPNKGTCTEYTNYIFEDGTVLPIYKDQGVWCEEQQKYITVLQWEIGWTTKKVDGTLIKLIAKEEVKKPEGADDFEHYFLYTFNGNYSVNDVLTCTSRAKALNAYKQELKNGSNFILPAYKVRQWTKEVSDRLHKDNPTFDKVCRDIIQELTKSIAINEISINNNKKFLADTDYKVQKYLEGVLPEEEYQVAKSERAAARENINNLEAENASLQAKIDNTKLRFTMKPSRPHYPSIAPDSQILMADGSYKAIKDIIVGDEVQYLSDDKQHIRTHQVVLPIEPEYVWEYKLYTFEDGTQIKIHGQTNLFNIQLNKYYPDKELKIGDKVRKADGTEVAVTAIENIQLDNEETFYRISTLNGNFSMNDIQSLVSRLRIYDEMMWEENEFYRALLGDEEMENWKNWYDTRR